MTAAAPYYRCHVFCCTNRRAEGHPRGDCTLRGGATLRDFMKAKAQEMGLDGVRINAAGCLDRCANGPVVVVYPDGIWYRVTDTAEVESVLREHLRDGRPVERLMLGPND